MKILWINEIMNTPQANNHRKVKIKKARIQLKNETNLCATCKKNFKTFRGLTQHQKKCKPRGNANNITVQPSTVYWNKHLGKPFHPGPTASCFFNRWGSHKMEEELVYAAFRWMNRFNTRVGKVSSKVLLSKL